MKRQLLLLPLIAIIILVFGSAAQASTFSDIKDSETETAVEILYNLGIVAGYDDGKYHPDRVLTRAQFCKMLVLALDEEDQVSFYAHLTLFADVTSSHWAIGYVNLASSLGYINGYGNGNFGPSDSITYGQAITILLRALGYTTADIGYYWPDDYVDFAANIGLDADLGLDAPDQVSRGDAAILMVKFLKASPVATDTNKDSSSYYEQIASDSIDSAILLDNNATSDEGDEDCALFYINDDIVYYEQKERLEKSLIGCSGTIFLDDDDQVIGFVADEEDEYGVEEGILLDNNITSPDGDKHTAMFCIDGDCEYYYQVDRLDAELVGKGGYILVNDNDYVSAFIITDDENYSVVSDIWLLDSTTKKAWFYDGTDIETYSVADELSASLNGYQGILLLDEDDEVVDFILDANVDAEEVTISDAAATELYYSSTGNYVVEADTPVLYEDEDDGWSLGDWLSVYNEIAAQGDIDAAITFYDDAVSVIVLLEEL